MEFLCDKTVPELGQQDLPQHEGGTRTEQETVQFSDMRLNSDMPLWYASP